MILACHSNSQNIDYPNFINGGSVSTKAVWKSESSEAILNYLDDTDVSQFLDRHVSVPPNYIT